MRYLWLLAAVGCPAPTEPLPTTTDDPSTVVPTETPDPTVPTECVEPEVAPQEGLCAFPDRIGGFRVEDQTDFTVVNGAINDSVVPQDVFVPELSEGDCVLLGRPVLFCDPVCAAGETCNGTECVPFPRATDQGPIFISGAAECVEMQPAEPGFNYFFNTLPQPGMTPGADMQLDATNFTLHAKGVEPIAFPSGDWVMVRGEELIIEWETTSAPAKVAVSMSIDQHGSSPLRLDCLFDDDGSGTVPATLVDGLIDSGVTGFPAGLIERISADHTDIDAGCVDFAVSSRRPHGLDVDGFTPCSVLNPECPTPQVCDTNNEICVDP